MIVIGPNRGEILLDCLSAKESSDGKSVLPMLSKLLPERLRYSRLVRFAKVEGISPMKLLYCG